MILSKAFKAKFTYRLYHVLWTIAPMWIRHYLKKRSRQSPLYLKHWPERFGKPYPNPLKGAIWIHAVSVGETRAALPIIEALSQLLPNTPLLITQMTPTGRQTAETLFPQAQCRYLPYDHPDYVQTFLEEHKPIFGVLMETELWPNLIQACHQNALPLFLANARLSEKSLKTYQHINSMISSIMPYFLRIFAQSPSDAARFLQLNATQDSIRVTGNSKFDIEPNDDMRHLALSFKERIGNRQVIVCASTRAYKGHDEAEDLLLAWRAFQGDALLVIIPRHPERFEKNHDLAVSMGYQVQNRSDNKAIAPDTQVWIGDSMGELFAYYLCADIAFVGGSLVDTGCQNIIEPIACHKPTLFGYSTYNFQDATSKALAANAAIQVATAEEWYQKTVDLLMHPDQLQALIKNSTTFISAHQGASQSIAHGIIKALSNVKQS